MNFRQILLIVGILFFPTNLYHLAFVFNAVWLYFYARSCKISCKIDKNTLLLIYLITFILLSACIRYMTVNSNNIDFRDFYELGRFMPILVIMMYRKSLYIRENNLIIALFTYVVVDVLISYMQLNDIDYMGLKEIATVLYNNQHHADTSLLLSHRALGLSDGPGPHGGMLSLVFAIMICLAGKVKNQLISLMAFITALLCIVGITFSQSRTSFAVIIASLVIFMVVKIIYGSKKEKSYCIGSLLVIGSAFIIALPFIVDLMQDYKYLFTLFEYGLENHSYTAREDKWMFFIMEAMDNPEYFLIGHGKTYFGADSGAMDSEYVFVLCVYGVLVSTILLIVLYNIIAKCVKGIMKGYSQAIMMFIVTISGLICSVANSFWSDTRVLVLYAILLINGNEMIEGKDDAELN